MNLRSGMWPLLQFSFGIRLPTHLFLKNDLVVPVEPTLPWPEF